jgi:hypothetical protein
VLPSFLKHEHPLQGVKGIVSQHMLNTWFWWIRNVIIGLFSVFFLIFGVEVLIGAYALKDPQLFIMYFFSGSFITMVSLVGLLYPVFQVYNRLTGQSDHAADDD